LRPKTFSVLRFLVENAGRLVSKDEILASVWSDVAVTDDTLVQSIGEIRKALGEKGTHLIRTVPRRGYRCEFVVESLSADDVQGPTIDGTARLTDDRVRGQIGSGPLQILQASGESGAIGFLRPAGLLLSGSSGRRRATFAAIAATMVLVLGIVAFTSLSGFLRSPSTPSAASPTAATTKVGSPSGKPTLVVLPFADLGGNKERAYFTDGVTQNIINALGRFSALTVISWNAVAHTKGRSVNFVDAATRFGATYLIEGTVLQKDAQLRVTAQLFDVDGRVIWSGKFDEAASDLFSLQDRITTQITGALAVRVSRREEKVALAKPPQNLEAYDLYLRARPALARPSRLGNVEARALLRRAIQLDPGYATAHAALAETYHLDVSLGWAQSPAVSLKRAEQAASEALRLDGSEQRARIILGRIHLFYSRYEQANAEMERAIAINASDAQALAGKGNILMWMGEIDAAIETLELAQKIDPELNAVDRFSLGMAYLLKKRYAAAVEQAELNIRNSSGASFSYVVLAAAYAQLGRAEDAARVVGVVRKMNPAFDPDQFGNKLRNMRDLIQLREGFRKAGFYAGLQPLK